MCKSMGSYFLPFRKKNIPYNERGSSGGRVLVDRLGVVGSTPTLLFFFRKFRIPYNERETKEKGEIYYE